MPKKWRTWVDSNHLLPAYKAGLQRSKLRVRKYHLNNNRAKFWGIFTIPLISVR